jgi:membrane protein YdbS with pleckstrin-like domain
VATDDLPGERAITPLHPNQIWLLRIRGLIAAVTMVLPVVVLDFALRDEHLLPAGLAPGVVALLGLIALILLPQRRYRGWGYREEEDDLHIRHGLLMRVRTVVPFGRVQHIDTTQGPIERRLGLATLILHTSGTRSSAVSLPGLLEADADRMRDRIRAKIRQDLV